MCDTELKAERQSAVLSIRNRERDSSSLVEQIKSQWLKVEASRSQEMTWCMF